MLALFVLVIILLYSGLLIWVTRQGWQWGIQKMGWKGYKRYMGAGLAFLILTLPVFWDWLPTEIMYRYYCSTESGFFVYKSLEQWRMENPGVFEELESNNVLTITRKSTDYGFTDTYKLNQRINKIVNEYRISKILPIWRLDQSVIDVKTNEVLGRYTDFWTGYKSEGLAFIKPWLTVNKQCLHENGYPQHQFNEFKNILTGRSK